MIIKNLENYQICTEEVVKDVCNVGLTFAICTLFSCTGHVIDRPPCIILHSQSFPRRLCNLFFAIQYCIKSKVTAILWPSRKGLAVTKIFLLTRKKWFLSNFSTLTWWPAKILIEARCLSRSLFNSAGHFSSLNTHTAAPPKQRPKSLHISRAVSHFYGT